MERGQREGRRLAGTGLRDTEQVATFKQGRDRLALDGGGVRLALGFKGAQDRLGKTEFREIGHENLSSLYVRTGWIPGAEWEPFRRPKRDTGSFGRKDCEPMPVRLPVGMGEAHACYR